MIDLATSARLTAKLKELLARAERGDFAALAVASISDKGVPEVFADTGPNPLLTVALVGTMSALSTRLEVNVQQAAAPAERADA